MPTVSDLYLSGTGALTTSGATTTLSNLFTLTGADNSLIDAAACTLIITNPTASGQTITSGSLQLSDTIGGAVTTLTYNLPGTVSIAAGASQTFQIPLTSGLLKNAAVSVTFGANPSAATLSVLLTLHSRPIAGTDSSGREIVVGAAASGSAVSGNPVLVAGSDGTNARTVSTDASGHPVVVGTAAAGAAVSGNPVLVGGSDGTNAQALKTDTSGDAMVVGNVAGGVADSGNPVKVGGVGSSTAPTAVTNGQRQNLWTGLNGQAAVMLANSTGAAIATLGSPADAAGGATGLEVVAQNLIFNGATWDRRRTPAVFKTISAVTITNETTIWTPTSGKKFRLMGGLVSMGTAAGNVTLRDNTAGSTIFIIPKAPLDTPVSLNAMGNGILSAAANNVLTAQGASTETISGVVWGSEE